MNLTNNSNNNDYKNISKRMKERQIMIFFQNKDTYLDDLNIIIYASLVHFSQNHSTFCGKIIHLPIFTLFMY